MYPNELCLRFLFVEDFQIFKDRSCCFCPACVPFVVDELGLQAAEEALHHCVVVAIGRPAHTAEDHILREQSLVMVTRVLGATIAVMEQAHGYHIIS